MKALLAIAATLFATSAFAGTETITCAYNSNSDYQLDIVVDSATSQIVGASIYNVDWSQRPESTFKKTIAVGAVNPVQGVSVTLEDNTTLAIDYSVFEKGHNGAAIVNGNDEYHCW